ncbi:LPS sulfotransferase NodH [Rhodobium orientis]|uniref:Sulfotransferase n=1 Tax=Rhodobium orientis TaxID=34017 RepID=A0A327JV51_9HYPH|nr:Stf0 family sulfotransferase [Rhodobium orientis]MBB4303039.1 LPS sulfotransferase NodH [Rhodobium orientis]MBK5949597.1 sulfotransferase [Rhodobium orientis]RAI29383.1 sulfotransferase [Rhodobium orientis]
MTATRYESYVICTSPRSGSTLLCSLLEATGVAGVPDSYFHQPSVAEWIKDLGLSPDPAKGEVETLQEVFRKAIALGSGDTGMFGLRLQRHSFACFTEKLALLHPDPATDVGRLEAVFGRTLFVHLTREDKLDQAVSFLKAQQSGLWHRAPDGSELERLSAPQELRYDREAIAAEMAEMVAMDAAWADWFKGEEIDPLRLTYGGLSADPIGTLKTVLTALGRDPAAADTVEIGVAKLSDATNEDWVRRFRTEATGTQA